MEVSLYFMYAWKTFREKWITLQGGLEFSMKCHINMKIFLMVESMTFRKDERAFRRKDGRRDSLWHSLPGWCGFLSCDESIFRGW